MSIKYYLSNIPFEMESDFFNFWNKKFHKRPSSIPFLSGDTYRSISDFIYDETYLCSANEINNYTSQNKDSKEKFPIVFVSSWKLDDFVSNVLCTVQKDFILVTHQGDVNITNSPKYKEISENSHIIHWFAQNCTLESAKVTPLPIGLEDRWRHNAGALNDFKRNKYKNNKKRPLVLFGFSINTNPEKRIPCYMALSKNENASEIYKAPNAHLYRRRLSKYMFVASPPGNGLDCHRTWEAMYLRVIPIVEDNSMNRYFKSLGLPLYCIKDWNEIKDWTSETMVKLYNDIISVSIIDALYLDYWQQRIFNK